MPAFAEMLNNAMFNFRKINKADPKSFLHKILTSLDGGVTTSRPLGAIVVTQ